ncbi:MAG: sulfotransferase family 2 domain-containing protein, partial [Gaiellaceae bacterium]
MDNVVARENVEAPQAAEAVESSGSQSSPPFTHHVLQRTILLPELRVLFLPIPKAGCTSVLWLLAELAGIPAETFARSTLPEVSPALTVHDTSLWGEGRRLADYDGEERERVLTEDGWLRFTVVRHPGARLWSAWQSKLLLREPRFVADFGEEPWFPRMPETPADLVVDFRRFVAALPGGGAEDVHWAVQHDLARQLPLTHVGQVERLPETLALLQAQVSDERWPAETGRENRTQLPMPPDAYDGEAAAVLHERYRADFDRYGYEPEQAPSDGGDSDWEERVAPLLPALRETIDKHARIGQLHRLANRRTLRVQALEEKLE